ncbi:MAG TPA: tetratricopeptide repeat protein [Vicinamibacterales bacterium]|nr:tetratricopeptide repeat protein [Vicinamibacterales bacterium]
MTWPRVSLLVAALVCLALPTSGTAQAPRGRPQTPLQAATRALVEGRYAEIDALTEKLDQRDPAVAALRARALIERGRYADAEALVRPVASRAPQSEAALQLGLLMQMLGKDASADLRRIAALAESSDDPIEVARAARALRALGRFQEANAAYRDAASGAPTDAAIQTAWGDLFLEKYERTEALKSYQMSLQMDARWTPAIVGAAKAFEEDNPPQAAQFARHALEINPASIDAMLVLARQSADEDKSDEAKAQIQKALAVNPASLDAHALLAAIDYVDDKPQEYDAEVAKTLAIVPNYGEVYRLAGERAAHKYRFDEAVTLARRALSIDPGNAHALADLGMDLLRTGDEAAARSALEQSFKIDAYDVVTKNLLDVLDKVDQFVTIRDNDIIVRMDKDEAPVLAEYAVPLAHKAIETFSKRYAFTPKGPILIEIFPKHDDFAVRNLGLPGAIGALGICFGRVVSLDSPRARNLPGEFQWEATLWHELAHVFTLQMSNQRVPRWLTEGISEYEEQREHPEWRRDMDIEYAQTLNHDGGIKLKDFNAAFQNPKLITLAYFQGSLIVEYLVKTYGDAGINKLLRAYGQGLDTDAALRQALNTDLASMQAGFDKLVEDRFGGLRRALKVPTGVEDLLKLSPLEMRALADRNPDSFPIQMALGFAMRKAGQLDEAMQAFEKAAALVPGSTGKDSPHGQMAEIAVQKKDAAREIKELRAVVTVDTNNVEAARELVSAVRKADGADAASLEPVYQRIVALDPFDADAHTNLGRFLMKANDADAAAREFRAVVALGPVDRAAAFTDLADSYFKAGKRAEAKKYTLAALEIAPTYERAQELLLKLVDR